MYDGNSKISPVHALKIVLEESVVQTNFFSYRRLFSQNSLKSCGEEDYALRADDELSRHIFIAGKCQRFLKTHHARGQTGKRYFIL